MKPDIEIVGVVKDVKQEHVSSATQPYVYIPYAQRPKLTRNDFLRARQTQDPLLLASSLQGTVCDRWTRTCLSIDLKTMERVVEEDLFSARMVAVLSASFAGLGGASGGAGHLRRSRLRCSAAHARDRHSHGARRSWPAHVRLLIVKEVGSMVLIGVGVGLPLAYGLARFSESLLYGVHAGDPAVYALGLGLIALIALAACFIPARRATRVDPLVALRYQ